MTNDLISREKVLKLANPFTQYDEGGWGMDVRAVTVEDIESIPAVDAVLVVHGELRSTGFDELYCEWGDCSECGADNRISAKFCNNCGARLDGKDGVK